MLIREFALFSAAMLSLNSPPSQFEYWKVPHVESEAQSPDVSVRAEMDRDFGSLTSPVVILYINSDAPRHWLCTQGYLDIRYQLSDASGRQFEVKADTLANPPPDQTTFYAIMSREKRCSALVQTRQYYISLRSLFGQLAPAKYTLQMELSPRDASFPHLKIPPMTFWITP